MWQLKVSLRPVDLPSLTAVKKFLVCEHIEDGMRAAAKWASEMTAQWKLDQGLAEWPSMHLIVQAEGDHSQTTSWPPRLLGESPPRTTMKSNDHAPSSGAS